MLAQAAGYDVAFCPVTGRQEVLNSDIDAFSAVVLLHHDLDQEEGVLRSHSNRQLSISVRWEARERIGAALID